MPASRSQKDKATTPEGREVKTRWSCPFPGCRKTTSKKPDVRRHYRTHFDWIPFQCPYYETCRFQSQQESNVAVHIEQTKMHPDISPADLAKAKPVRVLPESSAPQLPPGWDQAPVASTPARTANPRRLPAAVRRTVAASDAPAGSLDNFRILSFDHSSRAKYQSNARGNRSPEARSETSDLSESEELSVGPSTPCCSSSRNAAEIVTPVYHMTTEHIQFPVDFSSKSQFGEMEMKVEPLTWTWDQLTAANTTDYTKAIFTDEVPHDFDVGPLFENYDYDIFGQVERPIPELIPGFETTDLYGWDLSGTDKFCPDTMAGNNSGLAIPDDVYYNPVPSPKFSDFSIKYEDSPSPVICTSQGEPFMFSPADYLTTPSVDSLDEFFFDCVDSSSWNQLSVVDWEELSQFQASS